MWRKRSRRRPAWDTGSRSRPVASSRASATTTRCTHTPGISRIRLSCSALSWATTIPTTACNWSGSRRCRCTSSWAESWDAVSTRPVATPTRTASVRPRSSRISAMTSAREAATDSGFLRCAHRPTAVVHRSSISTIAPAPTARTSATRGSTESTSSTMGAGRQRQVSELQAHRRVVHDPSRWHAAVQRKLSRRARGGGGFQAA